MAEAPHEARDVVALTEHLLEVMGRFDVDALVAFAHPSVEMTFVILTDVEGRTLSGVEGVREWARIVEEYFSRFEVEHGAVEVHGDWAVFDGATHWTGRSSGAETTVNWTAAVLWEDGLVREYRSCHSREEALAHVAGEAG